MKMFSPPDSPLYDTMDSHIKSLPIEKILSFLELKRKYTNSLRLKGVTKDQIMTEHIYFINLNIKTCNL